MAINESVRILQQVDLEITNEIVKICTKHNIEYFITSGTMLGAIRHRGFIPWDDDIDIGMMRDQYEKFLSVAEKELPQNLKLVTFMNSPEYHYYISRVVDTDTLIEEERMADGERETHVSVDVYAIDGSPNNVILRKIYYFKVMYHRALMSLCYKNSIDRKRKRGFFEKILLYIMEPPVYNFWIFLNPDKTYPSIILCALGNSNPLFYKASEISEITFSPLFFTFIL